MQEKIQIETAQCVKIDFDIASFGERFAGFIIDLLIFGLFYGFLSVLLSFIATFESRNFLGKLISFFPLYGWILYHFVAGIFFEGKTLGKKIAKTRIIRLDGEDLSPLDYFLRSIFFLVDLFLTAGTLGGLSILGTKRNQRLGGIASNSIVIKQNTSSKFDLKQILKIDVLTTHNLTYPGVKYLTEKDALIIKKVLTRIRNHKNDAHRKALRLAASNTAKIIEWDQPIKNIKKFLSDVLKDYIILTR